MKDVLHIVFINKNDIINNNEIKEIIIPDEQYKLQLVEDDPIVIPGIFSSEDEKTGEQIDAVFLFAVLKNEDIDCRLLFKAVKKIRDFCIENKISFTHYDEYDISSDGLNGVKYYITPIEINVLVNTLLDGI